MPSPLSSTSLLNDVPLDKETIPQYRLNIDGKVRSNLFPWNGQFSPQLAHAFLETYGARGDFVLDPFMGSGTVLVEAARLQQRAFGSEINPAACKMAQAYTLVNEPVQSRREALRQLDDAIHDEFGGASLFSVQRSNDERVAHRDRLLALWKSEIDGSPGRELLATLIVLLDFCKPDLSSKKILTIWRKLFFKVIELPFSTERVEFSNCDARKLPLAGGVIDLVVTSPPYIYVFNYHQQYRASVEALGWVLLHVSRSEM